ncbi:MAG: biotin--[acetyl-CoA-carboxylase] ligase [Methylobacterium frigidaeris]
MTFVLDPAAVAAGYSLEVHPSLGSTSTHAMALARDGEGRPRWVVTLDQTDGRGRRGKVWTSPAGNLAASLLWMVPPGLAAEHIATLGLVAGLALAEACDRARGPSPDGAPSPFRLKWPNDVLVGGAKVSGILLETELVRAGRAVVIGFGVNVAAVPPDLPYRATSLADCRVPADAGGLFTLLTGSWMAELAAWDRGRGFAATRERWLARAAGLGTGLSVQYGTDRRDGVFETIDDNGRMVLRLASGERSLISAGEVFFGTPAVA